MARLNLELLETFTTVIREGSFSAAANRLNLSQPAVSQQFRQLEHYFGVRLAERSGKNLRPTPAGDMLLIKAEQIHRLLGETRQAIAEYTEDVMGHVILGTGATACIHLMPSLLRQLRQDYPRLTVGVRTGNTRDIIQAVIDNRIDAGLVTLPIPSANVAVTPVMEDELVAISNDPAFPESISPAFLHSRPLILFERGSSTRTLIDRWFNDAGTQPQPVMELGSIEAIKEMVLAGLGCSIVPKMSVGSDALASAFHIRPLSPTLHRTLAIVMRQDKPLNKALRLVLERLKKGNI
ncbi:MULTISPECIES: LysR family transcriptional regulator [Dickeya]|uniref:LysR family transcriptional regulator n=1 Tax=Dickeya fangzhongdai TaxID=1778540 RepID=A0A2K8QJ65_9GAMM|nr:MULTISPECIES: LysR family transcriptional regulator [Dickeya]ATZ93511.1 LysR family transcriptional regulator [Dickeya fangzhongdai]QOH46944.1 LysR family transcriptional regulator [Dickeya fangzhongdai]QOH51249.1 LysR family transcriptional regulator [Dickeya fangzhongdai]WOY01568.1 LysR family transcriptional regulator [Dickeya fangzhongdai]WOY03242.1 LysR family transcriptional regulator [Dickeya fangzhongdai]